MNLMMTSDFILPSSTLMPSMGPVLRGSVRIWDYRERRITKTVDLFSPDGSGPAQGTMDVKMLPKDRHGYGYTVRHVRRPHLSDRSSTRHGHRGV